MKTLITYFSSHHERTLLVKTVLLSTMVAGVYSTMQNKGVKAPAIKINFSTDDQFGDFDKVHVPNTPRTIAKMISVLRPEFSSAQRMDLAQKIQPVLAKYKIEPQIAVAIIDTESSFNHELVSSTGDLSMAQVNVEVWNKEFARMNLELIEVDKLKNDQAYSLEVMAQILHILKTKYEKKDRRWYARYHSKTKSHKRKYLSKLGVRMKLLEKSQALASR